MSRYFESIAVSRSEFEALKRFGDYEELRDGTLIRIGRQQGIPHLLRRPGGGIPDSCDDERLLRGVE
jgi:hypothetical protein